MEKEFEAGKKGGEVNIKEEEAATIVEEESIDGNRELNPSI